MNQNGNTFQGPGLQLFLDSAANASSLGQRQFFTPPGLASALATPFRRLDIQAVVDLQAGSGTLLATALAGHRFGIDLDERTPSAIPGKHAYVADCTRWFPLAMETRFKADLILGNPPFSLQWHAARLSSLLTSPLPGIKDAFESVVKNGTIDSTAAALLMSIALLSDAGEGFILCNAATARRLLGAPEDGASTTPLAAIRRYLWTWLEIPDIPFEGLGTVVDAAVLYFARSHGEHATGQPVPLYLSSPSADPATVEKTLLTALTARPHARRGREVKENWSSSAASTERQWTAIRQEYERLEHPDRHPAWNIWMKEDGTLARNLTTFQRLAVPMETITLLDNLHGAHPAALVVQRPTRQALRAAVEGGIWRVHPAVTEAVAKALAEYDGVRAPFYTPGPVQSMGWLDEESTITCTEAGLEGIHPGGSYPLDTWVEATSWTGKRANYEGKIEEYSYSGNQLVVQITSPAGAIHQFHVRRDDDTKESRKEGNIWHHDQSLIPRHFKIPCPPDIAQLQPERYTHFVNRLDSIEQRIRARLALPS